MFPHSTHTFRPIKPGATFLLRLIVAFCAMAKVAAQEILTDEGETNAAQGFVIAPFGFYNSQFGPALGLTLGAPGLLGSNTDSYVTFVRYASGTTYGFLELRDLRLPGAKRFFWSTGGNVQRFSDLAVHTGGNPQFADERAGSNDSNSRNFIHGNGTYGEAWLQLKYILPLGAGRDDPESHMTLRDGIPIAGAREPSPWNPLVNGFTIASVTPFYRSENLDAREVGVDDFTTAGAEFALRYENTDFSVNPARGSSQQIRFSRDPGWGGSSAPWETADFTASKFFSLGSGPNVRQRVLALNFWIIDTPSWNESAMKNDRVVFDRPPPFAGATLGGQDRMRGFADNRFNDRSAVYYAAEYRVIPDWNPLRDIGILKRMDVKADWFQFVGSIEVGRVADRFDLGELHSDMKLSIDAGIRAMLNQIVVRADVGISREGPMVQMTVDEPF